MTITLPPASAELLHDIDAACDRIAPTWPLDQFIAVNPYWGWRSQPIQQAAARLGVLAGTSLTMPRSWFAQEWRAGRLATHHLDAIASELGDPGLAAIARAVLERGEDQPQPVLQRMALVTDLRDQDGGPVAGRTWTEIVVHQIGQHLAARFDEWQASWAPDRVDGLFAGWRIDPSVTHGVRWRLGGAWARATLAALPEDPATAIGVMTAGLGIPESGREAYLTAVLASVNGWAAWCAQRRWQARLVGGDDDAIVELAAIRLAWDWLLAVDMHGDEVAERWNEWAGSWALTDTLADETAEDQRVDWVLQAAIERTHQDTIAVGLPNATPTSTTPEVQAVFCIDVRSEVFRRALEATSPAVHTRGFAGFFGLPIAYTPVGSALTRPQLPGLLAPSIHVGEAVDAGASPHDVEAERAAALEATRPWQQFRSDPSSVFTFVESMGLLYGVKLVKDSVPHVGSPERWELDGIGGNHHALRPRLEMVEHDPAGAAALGHRVLTGMGLLDGFAPIVMLCGHGSHTANNPHAAGLDCGACGGQTGEVNARVLAGLLNDERVRAELSVLGVRIPPSTWFVPALHDTTTDTVALFDTDLAPSTHTTAIGQLGAHLAAAGTGARAERADALGLGHLVSKPEELERTIQERANDWSQVRPEWGLAGNAAFIVAPRWRTRHLDLAGRCFLHDYDWRRDTDLGVLTLIMTAPMVVTNWINLQYHASTVDNRRYGSGNKVLHNVVGGRLGVFEGNGGDLRIGLPMQSLHDGTTLRHRPLRLSVFIEAPRQAIEDVMSRHEVVRDLVGNGWLHLLRIDSDTGAVERISC